MNQFQIVAIPELAAEGFYQYNEYSRNGKKPDPGEYVSQVPEHRKTKPSKAISLIDEITYVSVGKKTPDEREKESKGWSGSYGNDDRKNSDNKVVKDVGKSEHGELMKTVSEQNIVISNLQKRVKELNLSLLKTTSQLEETNKFLQREEEIFEVRKQEMSNEAKEHMELIKANYMEEMDLYKSEHKAEIDTMQRILKEKVKITHYECHSRINAWKKYVNQAKKHLHDAFPELKRLSHMEKLHKKEIHQLKEKLHHSEARKHALERELKTQERQFIDFIDNRVAPITQNALQMYTTKNHTLPTTCVQIWHGQLGGMKGVGNAESMTRDGAGPGNAAEAANVAATPSDDVAVGNAEIVAAGTTTATATQGQRKTIAPAHRSTSLSIHDFAKKDRESVASLAVPTAQHLLSNFSTVVDSEDEPDVGLAVGQGEMERLFPRTSAPLKKTSSKQSVIGRKSGKASPRTEKPLAKADKTAAKADKKKVAGKRASTLLSPGKKASTAEKRKASPLFYTEKESALESSALFEGSSLSNALLGSSSFSSVGKDSFTSEDVRALSGSGENKFDRVGENRLSNIDVETPFNDGVNDVETDSKSNEAIAFDPLAESLNEAAVLDSLVGGEMRTIRENMQKLIYSRELSGRRAFRDMLSGKIGKKKHNVVGRDAAIKGTDADRKENSLDCKGTDPHQKDIAHSAVEKSIAERNKSRERRDKSREGRVKSRERQNTLGNSIDNLADDGQRRPSSVFSSVDFETQVASISASLTCLYQRLSTGREKLRGAIRTREKLGSSNMDLLGSSERLANVDRLNSDLARKRSEIGNTTALGSKNSVAGSMAGSECFVRKEPSTRKDPLVRHRGDKPLVRHRKDGLTTRRSSGTDSGIGFGAATDTAVDPATSSTSALILSNASVDSGARNMSIVPNSSKDTLPVVTGTELRRISRKRASSQSSRTLDVSQSHSAVASLDVTRTATMWNETQPATAIATDKEESHPEEDKHPKKEAGTTRDPSPPMLFFAAEKETSTRGKVGRLLGKGSKKGKTLSTGEAVAGNGKQGKVGGIAPGQTGGKDGLGASAGATPGEKLGAKLGRSGAIGKITKGAFSHLKGGAKAEGAKAEGGAEGGKKSAIEILAPRGGMSVGLGEMGSSQNSRSPQNSLSPRNSWSSGQNDTSWSRTWGFQQNNSWSPETWRRGSQENRESSQIRVTSPGPDNSLLPNSPRFMLAEQHANSMPPLSLAAGLSGNLPSPEPPVMPKCEVPFGLLETVQHLRPPKVRLRYDEKDDSRHVLSLNGISKFSLVEMENQLTTAEAAGMFDELCRKIAYAFRVHEDALRMLEESHEEFQSASEKEHRWMYELQRRENERFCTRISTQWSEMKMEVQNLRQQNDSMVQGLIRSKTRCDDAKEGKDGKFGIAGGKLGKDGPSMGVFNHVDIDIMEGIRERNSKPASLLDERTASLLEPVSSDIADVLARPLYTGVATTVFDKPSSAGMFIPRLKIPDMKSTLQKFRLGSRSPERTFAENEALQQEVQLHKEKLQTLAAHVDILVTKMQNQAEDIVEKFNIAVQNSEGMQGKPGGQHGSSGFDPSERTSRGKRKSTNEIQKRASGSSDARRKADDNTNSNDVEATSVNLKRRSRASANRDAAQGRPSMSQGAFSVGVSMPMNASAAGTFNKGESSRPATVPVRPSMPMATTVPGVVGAENMAGLPRRVEDLQKSFPIGSSIGDSQRMKNRQTFVSMELSRKIDALEAVASMPVVSIDKSQSMTASIVASNALSGRKKKETALRISQMSEQTKEIQTNEMQPNNMGIGDTAANDGSMATRSFASHRGSDDSTAAAQVRASAALARNCAEMTFSSAAIALRRSSDGFGSSASAHETPNDGKKVGESAASFSSHLKSVPRLAVFSSSLQSVTGRDGVASEEEEDEQAVHTDSDVAQVVGQGTSQAQAAQGSSTQQQNSAAVQSAKSIPSSEECGEGVTEDEEEENDDVVFDTALEVNYQAAPGSTGLGFGAASSVRSSTERLAPGRASAAMALQEEEAVVMSQGFQSFSQGLGSQRGLGTQQSLASQGVRSYSGGRVSAAMAFQDEEEDVMTQGFGMSQGLGNQISQGLAISNRASLESNVQRNIQSSVQRNGVMGGHANDDTSQELDSHQMKRASQQGAAARNSAEMAGGARNSAALPGVVGLVGTDRLDLEPVLEIETVPGSTQMHSIGCDENHISRDESERALMQDAPRNPVAYQTARGSVQKPRGSQSVLQSRGSLTFNTAESGQSVKFGEIPTSGDQSFMPDSAPMSSVRSIVSRSSVRSVRQSVNSNNEKSEKFDMPALESVSFDNVGEDSENLGAIGSKPGNVIPNVIGFRQKSIGTNQEIVDKQQTLGKTVGKEQIEGRGGRLSRKSTLIRQGASRRMSLRGSIVEQRPSTFEMDSLNEARELMARPASGGRRSTKFGGDNSDRGKIDRADLLDDDERDRSETSRLGRETAGPGRETSGPGGRETSNGSGGRGSGGVDNPEVGRNRRDENARRSELSRSDLVEVEKFEIENEQILDAAVPDPLESLTSLPLESTFFIYPRSILTEPVLLAHPLLKVFLNERYSGQVDIDGLPDKPIPGDKLHRKYRVPIKMPERFHEKYDFIEDEQAVGTNFPLVIELWGLPPGFELLERHDENDILHARRKVAVHVSNATDLFHETMIKYEKERSNARKIARKLNKTNAGNEGDDEDKDNEDVGEDEDENNGTEVERRRITTSIENTDVEFGALSKFRAAFGKTCSLNLTIVAEITHDPRHTDLLEAITKSELLNRHKQIKSAHHSLTLHDDNFLTPEEIAQYRKEHGFDEHQAEGYYYQHQPGTEEHEKQTHALVKHDIEELDEEQFAVYDATGYKKTHLRVPGEEGDEDYDGYEEAGDHDREGDEDDDE